MGINFKDDVTMNSPIISGNIYYKDPYGGGSNRLVIDFDGNYQHGSYIGIGGGGLVVVGAGESTGTIKGNRGVNNDTEILILGSDGGIEFTSNLNSGWDHRRTMGWGNGALSLNAPTPTLTLKQTLSTINEEGRINFENIDNSQAVRIRFNHYDSNRSPYGLHIERCGTQTSAPYLQVDGEIWSKGWRVAPMDDTTFYSGMCTSDAGTSNWIRTTTNGIIPKQSGGYSALGTSSWPFREIFAQEHYFSSTCKAMRYYTDANGAAITDTNVKNCYYTAVTGISDAPSTNWWHVLNLPHSNGDGYGGQIALGYYADGQLFTRTAEGAQWGSWREMLKRFVATSFSTSSLPSGQIGFEY